MLDLRMLIIGAALAVALAGCGGDDGPQAGEDPPATTDEAADEPASPDEDEGGDEDEVEDEVDGEIENQEATDDVAQAPLDPQVSTPTEPVKVTYRMSGVSSSDVEQMTISWDSPRYAMMFGDGKLVVDGTEMLFCDAESGDCLRLSSGPEGVAPLVGGLGGFFGFAAALQDEQLLDAEVTGEAQIAGRTASCATYDAAEYDPSLTGEGEYCFDRDSGVLLRWSGTDASGETQVLEATEVGEPDPSDFEPTGPIQEMPGVGG